MGAPSIYLVRDDALRSDESSSAGLPHVQQIARTVLQNLESADKHRIPMLPRVASRALQIASDPRTDFRQLEAVIQPDPMLTARVLAIANSSLYGGGAGKIANLRNAMMRLGVDVMRDVLYQSIAEAHVFRGASEAFLRHQRVHSCAVAYLSRDLCKSIGLAADAAFLAGLMHDVGAVIVRQVLESDPPASMQAADVPELTEILHPNVGRLVCKKWGLPDLVTDGARYHHEYRGEGHYSQIGHIVACAERLAAHAGLGDTPSPDPTDVRQEAMLYELGLGAEDIEALVARAEGLAGQLGRG